MKYTMDELLNLIVQRSKVVRRKRANRVTVALSSMSLGLLAALVASFAFFSDSHMGDVTADVFGASLVPVETGGLVLVGVICFVSAVILTAWCVENRNRRES